ncbi:hypothetical protein HYH02_002105 [Chlamydomonas schloesseri]|uniref:Acyl-CoA dehydrogenase n=1 Tax=Chlamydomonas schloesseri TaxID=2026947 RepID=A0A835WTF9_9CHLO|nr:hypothetical protein HYH02_002105 [Chlamydomonas schloesseri]|eukprot:KAG2453899.1 hypothetical protein HYH02_002105 [Chlamydomonas schloesseri]
MSSFSTLSSLGPVRAGHQIDTHKLEAYLRQQLPALFNGVPPSSLGVKQFSHGQSNPTFLVTVGQTKLVLRKKPPGKLLASAHAVDREYRVLAALSPSGFPVPRAVHLCAGDEPLGTPFYLMECAEGRVFLDPNLPELAPQQRGAVYRHMAQVLARLHSLDPAGLGLAPGYGNPDHYCARQLRRWSEQYRASVPAPMPEVLRLMDWLGAHVPPGDARPARPAVVHGDYRLDNIVFASPSEAGGAQPLQSFTPLAVLDWELSTLGNPWADVAYNCLPYHLPPHITVLQRLRRGAEGGGGAGALPAGVPSEQEYLGWYCAAAGVSPPPADDWAFYLALSLFRLLAILAGVQARAKQGNASSANAARVASDEVLRALAESALAIIARAEAATAAGSSSSSSSSCGSSSGSGSSGCACRNPACTCDREGRPAGGPGRQCSCTGCSKGTPASQPSAAAATAATAATAAAAGGLLGLSPRAAELRSRLAAFMAEHVYPAEEALEERAMGPESTRWTIHPLMEELKAKAKKAGLWNLWLPAAIAANLGWLRDELLASAPAPAASSSAVSAAEREAAAADAGVLLGAGLTNLDYGHLCELMGRSAWAPEVFNCSAPDTGNMEVLAKYGTREQQRTWLLPLLRGAIRSCFAMTEKAVASSDATNITATIARSPCGGFYTLSGVKWWTSGACDPRCAVAIFMGKTDTAAAPHKQQSMVLVPMDAPGVKVVRPMLVFGYDDAPHGHAEVHFTDVRVPASHLILGEGRGFEIAQGRLGPGRLHHCMRLVGAGERAMELMAKRGVERRVFGGPLAAQGAFRATLAKCRIDVDGARLLVLAAADALDRHGFKGAAAAIGAAKVAAPNAVLRVLDAAIQAHGGAGVSQDFVLARLWTAARTLRIADGPDEVHLGTIAKLEMKRQGLLPAASAGAGGKPRSKL